jgi:putrescine aminotransferase
VRQICDEYDVLLIADEVITGFGRTGAWFALGRWGVEPDILSFAKGVTSGYLPLGGIQVSDPIRDAIMSAPAGERWLHAYTYSGHPTCCAVALVNLDLLEREHLVDNAARMGERLLQALYKLQDEYECIGNVRGLGLMCAIEFVADRDTKEPAGIGAQVQRACIDRGLLTRIVGDSLLFAPPLVIAADEIDTMVQIARDSIAAVLGGR